jgi:flavin-dependent dehydrogenase
MDRCDAAVVGAGPAGSAAAARLAAAGARVVLIEKDAFPRRKVCGEFLAPDGIAALEDLGALDAVVAAGAERIDSGRIHVPGAAPVTFRLHGPALGISRFVFDELLARRAAAAGARLLTGARVLGVEGSPEKEFRLRISESETTFELGAKIVIGAWGRWDVLDRSLDRRFLSRAGRFFGWNVELEGDSRFLEGEVRLYLFAGGYCGLSRVEGGRVNLAGVISESVRRSLPPGWPAVVEHARQENEVLARDIGSLRPGRDGFLGTGPVFFTAKPPVERGMLMAGDAAGVIDPFSGQGQSSALGSGILAGDTAALALSGGIALARLPRVYAAEWRRRFGPRFAWSALFRRMMLNPGLGSAAARFAGRPIVELAMRKVADQATGDR